MSHNRYTLAGWLAIVQAILFPLAILSSIVQTAIGAAKFHLQKPILGPSELLFIAFTVIGVYVILTFKKLLNDRYENHDLDVLIILSIC